MASPSANRVLCSITDRRRPHHPPTPRGPRAAEPDERRGVPVLFWRFHRQSSTTRSTRAFCYSWMTRRRGMPGRSRSSPTAHAPSATRCVRPRRPWRPEANSARRSPRPEPDPFEAFCHSRNSVCGPHAQHDLAHKPEVLCNGMCSVVPVPRQRRHRKFRNAVTVARSDRSNVRLSCRPLAGLL